MTSQEEKEYSEILEELIDTTTNNLITYIHLETVHVLDMDILKETPLLIDDKYNVIQNSVNLQLHNPQTTNTIQVNYGKGDTVYHVTKQVDWAVQKYGIHKEEIDKNGATKFEAEAYATNKLRKIIKKEGYHIDLTVIAHPLYNIGKICKLKLARYDINDYFQITRLQFKYDANKTPTIDLTLVNPRELDLTTTQTQSKNTVSTQGGWRAVANRLGNPKQIRDWIKGNIKYQKYYNSRRNVDQTFNDRRGNCYDQTNLAVAMMKHIGYNAWRVCGQRCNGIAHCNGRVQLNGRQITFDTVCKALNHL
jgi:Transglutaminase-like superfamily